MIVVEEDKVVGTLTDGYIRRAMLAGKTIDSSVAECYTRNIKSIKISNGIGTAIDLFKNESINFLLLISEDGKLENIFTKNQLHALLLQDIQADLSYNFISIDENIVDYEIFQRPWGGGL